jgi:aspartyl-tRNA synthetase
MPPLQQRYHDMLMEHVRADRYPSHQLLDRIEASIWTGEQMLDYIEMLIEKVDESHYPSHQMLDRIERMMRLGATVAV